MSPPPPLCEALCPPPPPLCALCMQFSPAASAWTLLLPPCSHFCDLQGSSQLQGSCSDPHVVQL